MNSRERVLAVLQGKVPDRVPLFELFIDPAVIHALQPGMSYEDFAEFADLDVVTCLAMAESPERMDWVDRERGIWRDKWGCLQAFTGEIMSVPMDPPRIRGPEDLASYRPPDPRANEVLAAARKLVERFKGKRAVCVVGEEVFAVPQYLRAGLANVMMDYVLEPGAGEKAGRHRPGVPRGAVPPADRRREWRSWHWATITRGKPAPTCPPPISGSSSSPALTTVVREVKNRGAYVIKHTDGNIWGIMDMLSRRAGHAGAAGSRPTWRWTRCAAGPACA